MYYCFLIFSYTNEEKNVWPHSLQNLKCIGNKFTSKILILTKPLATEMHIFDTVYLVSKSLVKPRSMKMSSSIIIYFQDVMNIYSFLYPEELLWLPCSANYRADFCLSDKSCVLNSNGLILHGSRAAFHENWQFGGSFFTNYLPKVLHWFIFKNLRLVEYAFVIR